MQMAQLTFEALVNAYSADLYRYAYWLCKQTELAEDLVQETFIRAWKAIDKLENPDSAKSWLFAILRRELSRHYGKKQLEIISLDSLLDSELVIENDSFGQVEYWVLQRAMKKLPEKYLEPLLLQVIAGYRCEEIAQILGLKSDAVMKRVSRARQQLRQYLVKDTNKPMREVK